MRLVRLAGRSTLTPPSLQPPPAHPNGQKRKTTAAPLRGMMPMCECQMLRYNCIAQGGGRESVRGSSGRGQVWGRRREAHKQRHKQPLALAAESSTLLTDHNPELRPLASGHTEGEERGALVCFHATGPRNNKLAAWPELLFSPQSTFPFSALTSPSSTETSIGTKWLWRVVQRNHK